MSSSLSFIIVALIFSLKTCAQQTIIPAIDTRVQYSDGDWLRPSICTYIGDDVLDPNGMLAPKFDLRVIKLSDDLMFSGSAMLQSWPISLRGQLHAFIGVGGISDIAVSR